MKLLTNSNESNTSLGVLERLAYASGNLGNGLFAAIISAFLLFFYTNYMHLNPGIIGTIFMAVRITDGITDLIMGRIVDKTRSKHGQARIWILRTCIPYSIATVLLFTVPVGAVDTVKYVYVAIVYMLVSAILTTAFAVPYVSLAALLTDNPYERGLLGVFSMFSGTFAGMIISGLTIAMVEAFGDNQNAWIKMAIIFAVVGALFELVSFFGTKERVKPSHNINEDGEHKHTDIRVSIGSLVRNKYWVMFIIMSFGLWMIVGLQNTAMIYYCDSVLMDKGAYATLALTGNVSMLGALLVAFVFMKKLGKENTFRIGMVLAVAGVVIMIFFPTVMYILIFGTFVRSVGSGLAAACMTGILADTLDYSEWKNGVSVIGMGMAAYSACMKLGSGISAALWGGVLNIGNYNGAVGTQLPSAIMAIKAGFYYIPFAVALISFILIMQFDLDKKHDKIHADLEERRGRTA